MSGAGSSSATAAQSAPVAALQSTPLGAAPGAAGALVEYTCIFVLGRDRYALSTKLLQEVVRDLVVESVPLTPPHVLGIFNLRGTPTVLLDTEILLRDMRTRSAARSTALVMGDADLRVALSVDRVDGVLALEGVRMMAMPDGGPEYCRGYFEVPGQEGFVALLSSEFLLQRIHSLQPTTRPIAGSNDLTETP
jgi:purine-binding chemotaxis protein CheW